MKIAICDDCGEDRKKLHGFLKEYALKAQLEFEVEEFSSAEALLEGISGQEAPELVFLDIFMEDMNGMEAAKALFAAGFSGAFVFTTASPDYAREGYRVHAADYLLKPYDYSAFCEAMNWCKSQLQEAKKAISFVSERFDISIFLSDIIYIESCQKTVWVHARDRRLPTSKTLSQFEEALAGNPAFLRIERGLLINFGNVKRWDDSHLLFENGERLALPVRNRKKILQKMEDYYWKHIAECSRR